MDYIQNIKNSPLKFAVRKTSIQLVTKWLKCASYKYDSNYIRKIDFDETEVENDFIESLANAIESLVKEKSKEKKSISGWSFGYICGYMQGSLNVKWSNRYLIEPSEEFADLMKIKSIIELLRYDSDTLQKIEIIYDYFLTHKNRMATEEESLPDNVVSLVKRGMLKNKNKETLRKEFDVYLEKILMTNYMSLMQSYNFMCCPDLTDYLDEHEVINLVGRQQFA